MVETVGEVGMWLSAAPSALRSLRVKSADFANKKPLFIPLSVPQKSGTWSGTKSGTSSMSSPLMEGDGVIMQPIYVLQISTRQEPEGPWVGLGVADMPEKAVAECLLDGMLGSWPFSCGQGLPYTFGVHGRGDRANLRGRYTTENVSNMHFL